MRQSEGLAQSRGQIWVNAERRLRQTIFAASIPWSMMMPV
jgi:hypothetical protein